MKNCKHQTNKRTSTYGPHAGTSVYSCGLRNCRVPEEICNKCNEDTHVTTALVMRMLEGDETAARALRDNYGDKYMAKHLALAVLRGKTVNAREAKIDTLIAIASKVLDAQSMAAVLSVMVDYGLSTRKAQEIADRHGLLDKEIRVI